jgi:hypothetical protein
MYAFLCVVPDLDPTYFLLASIPVAFSGALVTLITGLYAYVTDTTAAERRALRYVFGNFCFFSYIFHIESSWKTKWIPHEYVLTLWLQDFQMWMVVADMSFEFWMILLKQRCAWYILFLA